MDVRTVALITLYVIVGFVIYVWLAIPPGTGWDGAIDWGDVATWLSSIATTAAVFVALHVAAAEGRRSAAEAERAARQRSDDDELNDYRTALLVQPSLANAHAACGGVLRLMKSGIDDFSMQEKNVLLDLHAFQHLAGMADHAKSASSGLSANLLRAIAYSQQMVIAIDTCLELTGNGGWMTPRRYQFTGVAARAHVYTTAQFVAGYVLAARVDVEAVVARFAPPEPFTADSIDVL